MASNGHILCNKMHNEDNKYGLRVTSRHAQARNPDNPYWIAYGDKMLHHKKNSQNFIFAQEAVQCAVNDVFQASQGEQPILNVKDSKVFDYIPQIDNTVGMNNTPMFQIRKSDGKVCRRNELRNLQCRLDPIDKWTTQGTLSALDQSKPRNPVRIIRLPFQQ